MQNKIAIVLLITAFLVACASKAPRPVFFQMPARHIDYIQEVKPILDRRCAVCHSCYNSPCQLKLDSFEGADRGASKEAVYNGSRLRSMDPTRLFTDAQSTGEWRQKEFFSVTESSTSGDLNDSIMIEILSHKMNNPISFGEYRSEANDLTCSQNQDELGGYLEKHPNNGMPFGFPALKQEEFDIIAGWLTQGAKGPDAAQQALLVTPKESDALAIHELQKRAWQVLEPQYQAGLAILTDAFALAKSKGLGSDDLQEIAKAAPTGRIATLLIEADRQIAGRFDSATGRVDVAELRHPQEDDLLDDLGALVEKTGGRVVIIPAEQMPGRAGSHLPVLRQALPINVPLNILRPHQIRWHDEYLCASGAGTQNAPTACF